MTQSYPLIRFLLTLAGAAAGYFISTLLEANGLLGGPNIPLYLSVLGMLIFYLAGGAVAGRLGRVWDRLIRRLNAVEADAWLAGVVGATVALLLTVLLNNILSPIPGFTWYWSLLIALILVLGIGALFVSNRRKFLPIAVRTEQVAEQAPRARGRLIDTSAIIDGRIVDIFASNFLSGTVLIPRFVLRELQRIADDADPERRKRGRRGLEVLSRLSAIPGVVTDVIDDDPAGVPKVDDKLLKLASTMEVELITTDFNLEQVAAIQGVTILNPNQLAAAVRSLYLPGDLLTLTVSKEGREAGQGLAYLSDGTMVVVDGGAEYVGNTIPAYVTSSLQTNVGRMIFAKPAPGDADDPSGLTGSGAGE